MKSFLKNSVAHIKNFFVYLWLNKKKPKVYIPIIILCIIALNSVRNGAKADVYEIYTLVPQEFVQEVSVTGKVTPAQKVDMSFEVAGKIKEINTSVGTMVKKGEVLAELSNLDFVASVTKSQATYLSERARLSDLQNGSRPEEIRIAAADAEVALQNLEQARSNLAEQIKDSFAKADDAVKNQADQVFRYPESVTPELAFFVDGTPALKGKLELQRLQIRELYPAWLNIVSTVNTENITDAKINEVRSSLKKVQTFLNDLNTALSLMGPGIREQATNVQYRADISAARQSVNTSVQAFETAVSAYRTNQSALLRAQNQLALKQQGSTAEEIAAQRAQAESAAAGVSSAAASLNKTRLIAPFDGIVTRIAYKVGESVTPTDVVITLMSDAAFEVETFVSENDAPKLKVGQNAVVTLDALGDAVLFDAVINQVDLSETIRDGVVTYKTRMQFTTKDERIKSGLTANVTVESDRRADILKVPQSAIVIQRGKKYVKQVDAGVETWNKKVDASAKLVPVSTGAIDRTGDIEIVEGVTAGSKVIIKSDL